ATTASAASTTSTSSSRTSSRRTCSTWTWRRRSPTAPRDWASGTGPETTRPLSPTWCWRAAATCRRWSAWRPSTCCGSTSPISRSGSSTSWICSRCFPALSTPHGLRDGELEAIFTADKPVVFTFHGYPGLIHRLTYRRPSQHNLHVRGYKEHGNINTPLELAIRNQTDRFTLAMDALDRIPRLRVTAA